MNREYHRWYSPRLNRDMELLIFGNRGAKVLMLPTRDGRFWEYEERGIVASLRDKVEAGYLQLYCLEGIAQESLYDRGKHPADRIRRHAAYEDYILNEVLPLMAARNPFGATIVQGCSLGAFQAASLFFRHPHLFDKLAAFSGRYDLSLRVESFDDLFEGHYDEEIFYRTPSHFLPGLADDGVLQHMRRREIVLTIGREDPFLDNNLALSRLLAAKNIGHQLHVWDGRAHRASAWRKMAALYV